MMLCKPSETLETSSLDPFKNFSAGKLQFLYCRALVIIVMKLHKMPFHFLLNSRVHSFRECVWIAGYRKRETLIWKESILQPFLKCVEDSRILAGFWWSFLFYLSLRECPDPSYAIFLNSPELSPWDCV